MSAEARLFHILNICLGHLILVMFGGSTMFLHKDTVNNNQNEIPCKLMFVFINPIPLFVLGCIVCTVNSFYTKLKLFVNLVCMKQRV